MIDPEKFERVPGINNIPGNEGLPDGAKKFEDETSAVLLQKMWDKQVEYYTESKMNIEGSLSRGKENIPGLKRFETEISGHESKTFKGKLHPKVEALNGLGESRLKLMLTILII